MTALVLLVTLVQTAAPRPVEELTLLYFRADWCRSCATFDGQGVLARVQAAEPRLKVERVDVDAEPARLERYGVEVTPTLVLVDKDGFPVARPKVELAAPEATLERILTWVRKATGRGKK